MGTPEAARSRTSSRWAFTVMLLCIPALASAVTRTWPGAAPCNGTLQACANAAANGDRIEIATDGPIDESLNLNDRSLALVAAPGFHPAFVAGRGVWANTSGATGAIDFTLAGLRFSDADVVVVYNGTGTATYDLRGLEINRSSGGAPARLRVEANAGTVNAVLYDNRVSGQPGWINSGLIHMVNRGATLNANAYYNHVSSGSAVGVDGAGLFVDVTGNGAGMVKLHGNEVRGGFFRAGIFVSEGLLSSTASSFTARVYNNSVVGAASSDLGGSGIGFVVKDGTIAAQAINNTVTRCYRGITATRWNGGGPTARVDGLVTNNLIVAQHGLSFTPEITPSLSNDYNLINATWNQAVLGAHTITAEAQLASDTAPRLRATSPAVDAADTATLALGLLLNGLPVLDADGLRRIKGAADRADIGAYESGDLGLLHTTSATSISGHTTRIIDPLTNGQPGVDLLVTPNFNAGGGGGTTNNHPFGVYYFSSLWRLFNEDLAAMPVGAHFNVMVPGAGSGLFRHVSSAANNSGWTTRLDDGSVNDLPERIVLATQNWSAGSNVYNPHPIGVFYFAFGGPGRWYIVNADQQSGGEMPVGAGFNVYAQEASPNAFRVTATGSATSILLDHSLLNGIPCAQVQATRLFGGASVTGNFDVYYTSGRWRIYSSAGLPAGTQFNVLVNPAQVFDCTDVIFADGFQ